jgi:type I restriction enzyme S subunit
MPTDWDVKHIHEFTQVTTGGTPSTIKSEYWNGEIPWMNSGELNLKRVYEVANRITELGMNNSATKYIPPNCILIGLAGQGKTRGTVAINKIALCTNQSIAAIHPSSQINVDYLYHNLDSRYFELRGLSTGDGGRGGLNLTIIKNLLIPIPPLPEQTAIAEALSDADALIASLEKLIDKKKKIKQGAMQELLRPKEDWVEMNLTDIVNYIHGKAHERDIAEEGKYTVVNSKFISSNGAISKYSNVNNCPARKGDVLTVLSDLPNGKALAKCFLVDLDNKYAVNQRVCIWRTKGSDPMFLSYILNRHKYFLGLDDGVSQTHILNKHIEGFRLMFPPDLKYQRESGEVLGKLDDEIRLLETKLYKCQLIKQGMMQNLLTGKIRLI